jgi:hypothetical protein
MKDIEKGTSSTGLRLKVAAVATALFVIAEFFCRTMG